MLNHMPIDFRVRTGKKAEMHAFKVLTERYGLPLEQASAKDDMVGKTDWFYNFGNGIRKPCAHKMRVNKNDILVAVREPWGGLEDPENYLGRDMQVHYALYFSESPDRKIIRAAKGKVIHRICEDMWEELKEANYRIGRGRPMRSKIHPSCELRYTTDGNNLKPKILGFIPPDYLEKEKEIWYYENCLR